MSEKNNQQNNKKASFITINIGTLIFGAILLYIIITLIIYATTKHISTYQVIAGPLAQNQTYTALAVREEMVVNSNNDGYIRYYAQESRQISKAGAVYSLDQTKEQQSSTTELSDESLSKIRALTAQFATAFNPDNFGQVYSFKYSLAGSILDYAGLDKSSDNTAISGSSSVYLAPESGILLYARDGMEDLTADNFSAEDFSYNSYKVENLRTSEYITAGTPVYKLITSETWSILVPLSSFQASKLEGKKTIKVKFRKDGSTMNGNLELLTKEDATYAKITFSSGMVRFATDRYLDIELVTNAEKGLKIPVTAVVAKDFYLVPKAYGVSLENSSDRGFILKTANKDGTFKTEFINATIYASDDENYYVDMNEFSKGDVLVMENSTQTYVIEKTGQLNGVYNINRGYTVFRRIEIIDQNEEYCIVKTKTPYGLSLYDNIVLDGSTVSEDEILF